MFIVYTVYFFRQEAIAINGRRDASFFQVDDGGLRRSSTEKEEVKYMINHAALNAALAAAKVSNISGTI